MGGSAPPLPPEAPPPITPVNPQIVEARRRFRRLQRGKQGLRSTQLTGPGGIRPLPGLISPALSPTSSRLGGG